MANDLSPHEQRTGTRHAYMIWGVAGSLLVCAAILVWALVFLPGATQQPGGTGALANQGSGESTAAKNDTVTPGTDKATGAGPNSAGAAAQIEQTAGPLKLSQQQRQKIQAYFTGKRANRTDNADFALSVGAAVPLNVQLQKLPPQISSAMGGFQGDQYILVRKQLVIIDPNARRVVAIVPAAG